MKVRVLAVGTRQPRWVNDGFSEYVRRLPRGTGLALEAVAPAPGAVGGRRGREAEATRLLRRIGVRERVVVLDSKGQALSTERFAAKLGEWRMDGRDVTLVIGGASGLGDAVLARADFTWSLSPLTFPHGLARVMVAEQFYRASTILAGHPYHRGAGIVQGERASKGARA
ncbi:MAG: 23S rRNA (pseudouridine(1915)-N(3))-methyltransferase RlmH [Gammaproteobacteria bacterium]|nr:23S rRNA (pseudouridine(1915)-N(3))-methyltransferase RlmH [Gammaproteobacteria bacterium]